MSDQAAFTLMNPQNKELAFRAWPFGDETLPDHLHHDNYYTVILVTKGKGTLTANLSRYSFGENSLLCFAIYQPYAIQSEELLEGVLINFHPDFFCLHQHRHEVSCNGVLFNNIYESPVTPLDANEMRSLCGIAHELSAEVQKKAIAQYEVLISYLKILLINATRIQLALKDPRLPGKEPVVLQNLKHAIEENYKTLHSPSDYADLLHISTKALNRASKTHFNKTLGSLIAERIIVEAKRELYLTPKAIKLIAFELGFDDEFYFSRFFKNNVAVSPQVFRDTVGFDKDVP